MNKFLPSRASSYGRAPPVHKPTGGHGFRDHTPPSFAHPASPAPNATVLQRLFALIVSVLTLLLSDKYSWQYENQDHKNLHLQGMELYNMQCVAAIAVNNH
jgi:hypothetical protein